MFNKLEIYSHQKYLLNLPKLSQKFSDIKILFTPKNFRKSLLENISCAKKRIYIMSLYIEHDDGGKCIMSALYKAKKKNPNLDISILVDFHRAQRSRIGSLKKFTNSDWYKTISKEYPEINIPIYGISVNNREALGVLHMKGFIIDNILIYSGASINNDYLYKNKKYRFDRYQIIKNKSLTDVMISWINLNLKSEISVNIINNPTKTIKNKSITKQFKKNLRISKYQFIGNANNYELSVIPLLGLGKKSLLNKTIFHLILCTKKKLIFCTPYFNLPKILIRSIIFLLERKIKVEIIIGDKTSNDFYIPVNKKFNIIGILPYLYEINLRNFFVRLENFIKMNYLKIRLWKDGKNTFHAKGIWVDDKWFLITGNNLNIRAWKLDLENAILIHDPLHNILKQIKKELLLIRRNTVIIKNLKDLEDINDYPIKVKKIIKSLKTIKIDKLINYII